MGAVIEHIDPKTRAHAKGMFIAGVTVRRISRETGVKEGTIRLWSSRYKWAAEKRVVIDQIADKIADENLMPHNASQVATQTAVNVHVSAHQAQIHDAVSTLIDRFSTLDLKKQHSAPEVATALKTLDDIQRRNLGLGDESKANTHFSFHLGSAEPVKKVFDAKVVTVEKSNTSDNTPEILDK